MWRGGICLGGKNRKFPHPRHSRSLAQLNSTMNKRRTTDSQARWSASRRSLSLGVRAQRRFCAANILKMIVSPHCDAVLFFSFARLHADVDRELISLFPRIADTTRRRH